MRVSSDQGDPGYEAFALQFGRQCWVYLDGRRIDHDCVMADSDVGVVEVVKRDEFGNIEVDEGNVVTEMRHGVVVITPAEQAAH